MFYQGQIKNHVLRTELYGKVESEALIANVLEALPIKVKNTLFNFRTKLLGKVPRTRDEYDPTTFLHTLSGGEKITVLDSRDLPEKWTEYNIKDLTVPLLQWLMTEVYHCHASGILFVTRE